MEGLSNEMGSGDRRSRFVERKGEFCHMLAVLGRHPDEDDLLKS